VKQYKVDVRVRDALVSTARENLRDTKQDVIGLACYE
jgi:hypothetical protein